MVDLAVMQSAYSSALVEWVINIQENFNFLRYLRQTNSSEFSIGRNLSETFFYMA